jgi:hypothetical protein
LQFIIHQLSIHPIVYSMTYWLHHKIIHTNVFWTPSIHPNKTLWKQQLFRSPSVTAYTAAPIRRC